MTNLTFNPYSEPEIFKEVVLNALQHSCQQRYNRDFLDKGRCDFGFFVNSFADHVTLQFKGIVYGSKTVTDNITKVPDGLIANIKITLFPKWLLQRFPAKMKQIAQTITVYNSYPDIPVRDMNLEYKYYEN